MSLKIHNISKNAITSSCYDIALYTNGYESRCLFAANEFTSVEQKNKAILQFLSPLNQDTNAVNLKEFNSLGGFDLIELKANQDDDLLSYLEKHSVEKDSVALLVDYSSMTRIWYAAIIRWAQVSKKNITIDFIYSCGIYEDDYEQIVINDILAVPGFEGGLRNYSKSMSIIGLGYHSDATFSVYDQLESDECCAFFTTDDRVETGLVKKLNNMLLDELDQSNIYQIPMNDIELTYKSIIEIFSPYKMEMNITLVPMGPKPHILASLLVGIIFPEVCCLRVSAKLNEPVDVVSSGDMICTRVHFN